MAARIVNWSGLAAIGLAGGALIMFGWDCASAQAGGQTTVTAQAKPEVEVAPAAPKLPAVLRQDAAFARFIALIRGHLLTGDELVGKRRWDAAVPHFRFPTEEIYGIIREDVRSYKTPPFDGALKVLARTVKARGVKHYPKARQKVEDALAAADTSLRVRQPNWPRFVAEVAVEVLKTAPDEYDDAIVKGRVVRPIGYQTARGFILQAERMFESVAGEFAGDNAIPFAEIRAGFAQLKQVFANVNAPKQAIIDYSAVMGIVSRIELAAGKLT